MFRPSGVAFILKWLITAGLPVFVSAHPEQTEKFYSRGLYVLLRNIDLFFLRFVPFSAGDVLYAAFPLWFFRKILKLETATRRFRFMEKTLWYIVWIFYLSWGLNYYRIPYYASEELSPSALSPSVARKITVSLIDSVKHYRPHSISDSSSNIFALKHLRAKAAELYRRQSEKRPALYQPRYVVKPSLFSQVVSYPGVSGYFNPFTHEAQINMLYPEVFRPHVILHELAHQIGYAREDEAEFLAWQTATENSDSLFKYASHLTALQYFLRYWKRRDSVLRKKFYRSLPPEIQNDLRKENEFIRQYNLPVNLLRPYDYYLKLHQRGKGLESYDELMLYIAAYFQKKNKIAVSAEEKVYSGGS